MLDQPASPPNVRRVWLAIATLVLLPLLWLWPCVIGERRFVPYDLGQFPPARLNATDAELAAAREDANFDVTEVPVWFLPELRFARDELAAGRLPTWNPSARHGAPLHAHGLIGLCYPPNWLALAAPDPERALVFVAWCNIACGGLLMFGLLRHLGLGVLAAWFGALLFELSGPVAANAFFWMRLGSYVWLPGVLWAIAANVRTGPLRPWPIAGLAGAFALTWLAGFPPFALTTTVLGSGFAAWCVLRCLLRDGGRVARGTAARLALGFALGGALAAPQVLPSMQFFPHSARETKPEFQRIADQAFESYGLLGFVLPDAFGHPTTVGELPYRERNPLALHDNTRLRDGKPALPNFNYTEYAVFVGSFGLLLAVIGALTGRGRAFPLLAWLSCAGLALFWPGVRSLFLLPLIENVWPMRWLAPATVFVAWLAALGVERLQTASRALLLAMAVACLVVAAWLWSGRSWDPARRTEFVQHIATKYGVSVEAALGHMQADAPPGIDRVELAGMRLAHECARIWPWWLAAAVWCAAFAGWRSVRARAALTMAAGIATAVQLGAHGSTVTHGAARTLPLESPVHALLRQQAAAAAERGGFTFARGSTDIALLEQLPPGQLLQAGLRDLQFYSHFDAHSLQPLQALLGKQLGERIAAKGYLTSPVPETLPPPSVAADVANGIVPADDYVTAHPLQHPLLDLFGVRYVLATTPLQHAGALVDVAVHGPRGSLLVYERRTALPRAFAVAEVVTHADDAAVIRAMLANDFVPTRTAHAKATDVPTPLPAAAPRSPAPTPTAPPPRAVRFVVDTATEIRLDVAAGDEKWLLLVDTWLPGWRASIDGVDATIHRGNHAFRLVALPPNACTVTFTYHAPGLASGLALAIAATLGWLLWQITTVRRRCCRPALVAPHST